MKTTEEFLESLFHARQIAAGGGWTPTPFQRLVISFAAMIGLGTLLLWLPWSTPHGHPLSFVDALFTATSAVCVTGLIVQDTATAFSPFGQGVILFLIQLGGLGYMLLATASAVLLGRRFGMNDRVTIQKALNLDPTEGMGRFVRTVLLVTLGVELAGAIVIAAAYWPSFSPGRAMVLGVFHSISAYNNAGFSLFSDNLAGEGGKTLAVTAVGMLAVIGGLGFFVLNEFMAFFRGSRKRLSLHTKLVLATSAALLVGGTISLVITAKLSWGHSLFLSAIARTAGFNIESIGALSFGALFFLIPLMFIGASPGGTGGGIKTTTFALVAMSIWAMLRGREDVSAFRRRITDETIFKALMITVTMTLLLVVITLVVMAVENHREVATLFEVTSALGTVGLSMGNGGNLSFCALFSDLGKLLIALAMFIGRLGPLTLGLAAALQSNHPQVKYPEGRVSIG